MPGFVIGGESNFKPCPNPDGTFDNSYFASNRTQQGNRPPGNLEYLREYRYSLRPSTGNSAFDNRMIISCKKIKPPQVSVKTTKIFSGPDYIVRPLRKDYGNVLITFETVVEDSGNDRVPLLTNFYKWWENLHTVGSPGSQSQNPLSRDLNRKGANIIIALQDGYGRDAWRYRLEEAFPSKIDTKELTYSGDGLFDVSVTLEYGRFTTL